MRYQERHQLKVPLLVVEEHSMQQQEVPTEEIEAPKETTLEQDIRGILSLIWPKPRHYQPHTAEILAFPSV